MCYDCFKSYKLAEAKEVTMDLDLHNNYTKNDFSPNKHLI